MVLDFWIYCSLVVVFVGCFGFVVGLESFCCVFLVLCCCWYLLCVFLFVVFELVIN